MSEPQVILVNQEDKAIGVMGKLEAHEKGLLHRAFSVFVLNDKQELLLQRRALHKYHSPGLWTNSCCSHPLPEESTADAAKRRMQEEIGFSAEVEHLFAFTYKHEFENGLTEHEYDHVFLSNYNGEVAFNSAEVDAVKWLPLFEVKKQITEYPERFTPWFKLVFNRFCDTVIDKVE